MQGRAAYEHSIVLVSYNGHGRIRGTQLLKSMPTIRRFENKIDLLDALTALHCRETVQTREYSQSERKLRIHLRPVTEDSLTQQS